MNEIRTTIYKSVTVKYLEGRDRNYYNCADIKDAANLTYYLSTAISNNNMRDKADLCIKVPTVEGGKASLFTSIKALKRLCRIFTRTEEVERLKELIAHLEALEVNNAREAISFKEYAINKFFISAQNKNISISNIYNKIEKAMIDLLETYNTMTHSRFSPNDVIDEFDKNVINKLIDLFFEMRYNNIFTQTA